METIIVLILIAYFVSMGVKGKKQPNKQAQKPQAAQPESPPEKVQTRYRRVAPPPMAAQPLTPEALEREPLVPQMRMTAPEPAAPAAEKPPLPPEPEQAEKPEGRSGRGDLKKMVVMKELLDAPVSVRARRGAGRFQ